MVGLRFVSRRLSDFVGEIYVVVLALGFAGFANSFLTQVFEGGGFRLPQLVFFLAIYYFFAYDWLAYGVLIDEYPYDISPERLLSGHGRFYTDLLALLLKALLVYLTTNPFTRSDVTVAAVVLGGWHLTILGWYWFAAREYDIDRIWPTHLMMVAAYVGYATVSVVATPRLPDAFAVELLVTGLAAMIIVYASRRKRELIESLSDDTEGS